MKIIHNSRKAEYREPFGAAKTGTKVSLTIEIKDPAPESVRLMLWHGDDPAAHYLEMSEKGDGRYAATFPLPDEGCLVWYAFEIEARAEHIWMTLTAIRSRCIKKLKCLNGTGTA